METLNLKQIIIQLLVQDMKHEQLVGALHKMGFESDVHNLQLAAIVAALMGRQEGQTSLDWSDIYLDFMGHAGNYPVTADGANLLPLAEACYTFLHATLEREERKGNTEEEVGKCLCCRTMGKKEP